MSHSPSLCETDNVKAADVGEAEFTIPEKRLALAVLNRAAQDTMNEDYQVRRSAEKWFASDDISPWSYKWLMDHLGLLPQAWSISPTMKLTSRPNKPAPLELIYSQSLPEKTPLPALDSESLRQASRRRALLARR